MARRNQRQTLHMQLQTCAASGVCSLRHVQSQMCAASGMCSLRCVQPRACTASGMYSLKCVQPRACTPQVCAASGRANAADLLTAGFQTLWQPPCVTRAGISVILRRTSFSLYSLLAVDGEGRSALAGRSAKYQGREGEISLCMFSHLSLLGKRFMHLEV